MSIMQNDDDYGFRFLAELVIDDSIGRELILQMTPDGHGHGPAALPTDWSYTVGIVDRGKGCDKLFLSPDQFGDVVRVFLAPSSSVFTTEFRCRRGGGTKLALEWGNELLKLSICEVANGTQTAGTVELAERGIKAFLQAIKASTAFQRAISFR